MAYIDRKTFFMNLSIVDFFFFFNESQYPKKIAHLCLVYRCEQARRG